MQTFLFRENRLTIKANFNLKINHRKEGNA